MKKLFLFLAGAFISTLLNAQTVVTPNISGNPKGLVITNNYAYFVDSNQNKLMRIDIDNPNTPEFVLSNLNYNSYTLEPTSNGFLFPNTGGNNIGRLVVNGSGIIWNHGYIDGTGGSIGFAFEDAVGDIYFTRNGTTNSAQLRRLLSSPSSSSIVANLPASVTNVLDVATVGSEFYFSTTNGRIWHFNKNNPSAGFTQLVFAGAGNAITGIEATQDYLYYVDSINNRVVRINRANGSGAINLFNNLNIAYIDIVGNKVYGITSNQTTDKLYSYTDPNLPVPCTNTVTIPDANFKAALLAHGTTITGTGISVIDTDGDGEICQSEAQAYTGKIDVYNRGIADLTGIEVFTGLTKLSCNNNQLTSLDVSVNTVLEELSCNNNLLTSLSLPASTTLKRLECVNNQLTSLDVSANTALRAFNCAINRLTSLNVSTNTALESLACYTNQLTSLDVSGNSSLSGLYCFNNQLTSLNIANGNNTSMSNIGFQNNPNLTCINIDANVTPPNSWQKDNTANWSDDCQYTTFWSKATTGVTSDWATASNWTNGLPDQSYTGVIPAGANVYPVITTDASTNPIGILTIENGASLYIGSSGSLAADTVTNNGRFMIASNATDSGTFEATTVVGDITYQRYATNNWHLVGSPINGQDIDAFVSYASNALATNATTNAKAFAVYDNTQAQASDYWKYYLGGANSAMVNAKGYAVKRQNTAGVGVLQFKGTYNDSNVTYTGTGSTNNKFELVSNPYTRYLDLNNFLTSNTSNMSATNTALYFWNDAQNRYDVYNSASTGNQYIAPGQGFFAEMANTGGSFTFRPNMTTHNATGALLRTAPQTEVLISIAEGKSQKTTQIKYLANTGKGLDVGYDAGYFDGDQSNVGIYTKLADGTYNDTNFMLQCVGKDTAEDTVIPLGIKADGARTVTFTAEAMNLPDNLKVFLEDTQTGSVTELSNGGSYEATVDAGSGRFFIHTKANAVLSTNVAILEGVTIFKQGNAIEVRGLEEVSTITLYNLQGKRVMKSNVTSSQGFVSLADLSSGMYVVTVSNSKGSISKKVIF